MAEIYSILLAGLKTSEEGYISSHFSRSGHRIITARDFVDAKEKLKVQEIDLAYLQASSDDRAVNELTEIAGHFAALPVVFVSARPAEGLALDAWHAGAADILFLPLTPQSLDTSLQRGTKQILSREFERITRIIKGRPSGGSVLVEHKQPPNQRRTP